MVLLGVDEKKYFITTKLRPKERFFKSCHSNARKKECAKENELIMSSNKINFNTVTKLFKEGNVIISGGGKGKIKIKEIVEHGVRFQSLTGSYKGLLRFNKLNVVLDNFNRIPADQIQHNVFQILIKNGLFDSTHETNLYGVVKEFIKRSSK